jgi:hypothetical protein
MPLREEKQILMEIADLEGKKRQLEEFQTSDQHIQDKKV